VFGLGGSGKSNGLSLCGAAKTIEKPLPHLKPSYFSSPPMHVVFQLAAEFAVQLADHLDPFPQVERSALMQQRMHGPRAMAQPVAEGMIQRYARKILISAGVFLRSTP